MPPSDVEVRELVRRILGQLLDASPAPSSGAGAATAMASIEWPVLLAKVPGAAPRTPSSPAGRTSRLIDEATVRGQAPGSTLPVPAGALVTPLARQAALDRGITLREEAAPGAAESKVPTHQRIAIGADHGGYLLKEALKPHLQSLGYEVVDCGTHSSDAVDYPDIAYAVARLVADGKCANGVIVDGAGIGSCMAANKVPGIRAALCYDHATAVNSREHNHANVLTLGAGLIGANLAKLMVTDWLATPYGPGRHAKRVEKIMAIEKRYLK
jgi:ribose 5-phosphate isomerase B